MANETVFTDVFRLSYPHLDKPQEPQNAGDVPKYGIAMMFPQNGICTPNGKPTSPNSIFAALDKACMAQWNMNFAQASAEGMGCQFPPKLKDGNTVFDKDASGNPIPNQVNPNTADQWILSCKNQEAVGCVDPTGEIDIAPSQLLAGYWCCAELECAAYENKNRQKVISIKLINIQLCYKDETFGAKRAAQAASVSFAGRAIADTNIAQGSIPRAGVAPAIPSTVPTSVPSGVPVPPSTAAPSGVPVPPSTSSTPPPPPPPSVTPSPANNDPIIMNAGEPTYAAMIDAGWTDELIISNGKGKPNYLNPAV